MEQDDLFGDDGESGDSGDDVPGDPSAALAPCDAEPEGGGLLRQAAVEPPFPSEEDAPEEQEHEGGSSGGGEEKVKDAAAAAAAVQSRPRKQLPGKPPDVAILELATSTGKKGDAWDGVERGPGGEIVKIKWDDMDLNGSLPVGNWGMPFLTEFDVSGNGKLKGSLSPTYSVDPQEGSKDPELVYDQLSFAQLEPFLKGEACGCDPAVGDVVDFPPPVLVREIPPEDLKGRRIKVRWNPLAIYEGIIGDFDAALGMHQILYDDGDKKWYNLKKDGKRHNFPDRFVFEGAAEYTKDTWARGPCIICQIDEVQWPKTMAYINLAGCEQLKGDISKVRWPQGLQVLNMSSMSENSGLPIKITGRIDEVQWPETLTYINLWACNKLTGDISVAKFPTDLKDLYLRDCTGLTGDISVAKFPAGLEKIDVTRTKVTGDKAAARAKLVAAGCKRVVL